MDDAFLPFPRTTRRRRSSAPVRIEVGARSCWGYGRGLAPLLDEIGSPRMWCPFKKTLTFPVDRCDDLLALLEHRHGRVVELTAVA
ncbi:MAG TPA: hypothetical protein VK402_20145 [Blastococcus sp.]|nr:hypothetical protein [Blastococcus sp.]